MIELIEENVWNDWNISEKKNIVNISILYCNYNYTISLLFIFILQKRRKLEYSECHIQDIRTSHKGLVLRKRSRREKSIREYLWCNDYKE